MWFLLHHLVQFARPGTIARYATTSILFISLLFSFNAVKTTEILLPCSVSRSSCHPRTDISSISSVDPRSTLFSKRDDYSCSKDKPCSNRACCGKEGYCGYGPTYCGDGCQADCGAVAACGQFSLPANLTCPLNACCSEFGFCGTTADFCGSKCQSNCVEHPMPSGPITTGNVLKRVVGYYEAWSASRDCHKVMPSDLPIKAMTHVNFAFGSIDPKTYDITTMDDTTSADLFKTFTDIKTFKTGGLEVWISLGGWTFSDNNTETQPIFGDISADPAKRQQFADNLVRFMTYYGFDGVDIDWEYPGAPDRGGKPEDTKNFVELVKTARQTFDAHPRKFGLTFTIPTSFWYLRWFDLPGMLPYVDWINMMSYDLHGFWDRNNPIGNIVQGHTNLTEIKLAAELLWRVNIPPEKIVMGFAFYGRSFQLKDPSCDKPGCQFGGAAKPGPCTNEAGILGYFEIMDILKGGSSSSNVKRDTIVPIHDQESAVKYFVHDNDQFVSYDDNDTFAQKRDWANSMGFGGSMPWSPGLDDIQYSAMSALTGQQAIGGKIDDPNSGKAVSQHWAGQNGAQCHYAEKCHNDVAEIRAGKGNHCNEDEVVVGNEWWTPDCRGYRAICCPRMTYPRSCTWRGKPSDCNGQCHAGEVQLFRSSTGGFPGEDNDYPAHGGPPRKCTRGSKAFCCVADQWNELVKGCDWFSDHEPCKPGTRQVAKKKRGFSPDFLQMCCPEPIKFSDCYWKGKGGFFGNDCADNSCANGEIELATDPNGVDGITCNWGRRQALCCKAPAEESAFFPVDLKDLFPETPPAVDALQYDLQWPHDDRPRDGSPNEAAFGFVAIVGPPDVVKSSKQKRDGTPSELRFLDCHKVTGSHRQQVRFVCASRNHGTDCDHILEGGLPGSILEMPDRCGAGKYAVLHGVSLSADQSIPLEYSNVANRTVFELTIDYNFDLVKRDAGDIFFRVDYSNEPGYWDLAVNSSELPKRSLERRFFSSSARDWREVFDSFIKDHNQGGTSLSQDIDTSLLETTTPCQSRPAYAKIGVKGLVTAKSIIATTIVGSIAPDFKIDAAYTIMRTHIDAELETQAYVDGEFILGHTIKSLVPVKTGDRFSHPGLVTIEPTLAVDVAMQANASFAGNFSMKVHGWTSEDILHAVPKDVGDVEGQTDQNVGKTHFRGSIDQVGQPGALRLDFVPRSGLNIRLNKFGTDGKELAVFPHSSFYVSGWLVLAANETFQFNTALGPASAQVVYDKSANEIAQWDGESRADRQIGDRRADKELHTGKLKEVAGDKLPDRSVTEDAWAIFQSENDQLARCGSMNEKDDCEYEEIDCKYNICVGDPDYCLGEGPDVVGDDEDELAARHNGLFGIAAMLDPRHERRNIRPYNVRFSDGTTMQIRSTPYPSIGELFNTKAGEAVYDRLFDYAQKNECSNTEIIDYEQTTTGLNGFATEHIIELQTIALFLQVAEKGLLLSGRKTRATRFTSSVFRQYWNDPFPNNIPMPPIGAFIPKTPNQRVFEVLGTRRHRENFVACGSEINSVKGRIWGLTLPMEQKKFEGSVGEWLDNCKDPGPFLKHLKATIAVFDYMNDGDVRERLSSIVSDVQTQLNLVGIAVPALSGLTSIWDEFIEDFLGIMTVRAKRWVEESIGFIRTRIPTAKRRPRNVAQVEELLAVYEKDARNKIKAPSLQ